MTATDELRRMLDEAGVEWDYGITGAASTRFNANGVELTFIDMRDGITCSTILTPEQAIAATLGDGEYESKMDALLCRLTNGKWSMTRKYSLDFMESLVRDEFEEAFAAELVTETCRNVHEPPKTTTFWPSPHFKCSECGATHVSMEYVFYCPNCGRKVVDE